MKIVKLLLARHGKKLKSGKRPHNGLLPPGYKPKSDTMEECEPKLTQRHQQDICLLKEATELGIIDISSVVIMLLHQAISRKYLHEHYLSKSSFKKVVFDPTYQTLMSQDLPG